MNDIARIAIITLIAVPAALLSIAAKVPSKAEDWVERGKYLVAFGGCADCYTLLKFGPKGPEPDMTRFHSGHPEEMKLPAPESQPGPWSAAAAQLQINHRLISTRPTIP